MGDLTAHFSRSEFSCKCGCGFDTVDYALLTELERLRRHLDMPIRIVSGCRCPQYNAAIGGSLRSQHIKGRAADIQVALPTETVYGHLITVNPDRYGIGKYSSWVHIDTRNYKARW